jgi:hypothetical protein
VTRRKASRLAQVAAAVAVGVVLLAGIWVSGGLITVVIWCRAFSVNFARASLT